MSQAHLEEDCVIMPEQPADSVSQVEATKLSSESLSEPQKRGRNTPLSCSSLSGVVIQPRLRSTIYLAAVFTVAIILAAFTVAFAMTSWSRSLVYNPPFFPYSPQNALLVLQILATVSLMVMQECFSCCTEIFRWALACRGTDFLSFLIMSPSTGFGGLMNILITKSQQPFPTWRLLGIYKFIILYVAVLFGQFVWLLEIDFRPAYRIYLESVYSIGIPQSRGFSLSPEGVPSPYSTFDVTTFLLFSNALFQAPGSCFSDDSDIQCATNYSPQPIFVSPTLEPGVDVSSLEVNYDVPVIITQFQSNTTAQRDVENLGPWAYCLNHTSNAGSYLQMCMGGSDSDSNSNSSIITAGWQFCHFCSGTEAAMYAFKTTMSMSMARATVIAWLINGTIAGIDEINEEVPFAVNVSQLFTAFSAPLWVNQTEQWTDQGLYYVESVSNATLLADDFVDSLAGMLANLGLANQTMVTILNTFLTFTLYNNQIFGNVQHQSFYYAHQASALTITPLSAVGYIIVTAAILGCSVVMAVFFPNTRRPNISSYSDIMFAGKVTDEMRTALYGLSNATDRIIIDKLMDLRIKVGQDPDDEVPRIILSESHDVAPLRRGVYYT